MFVVNRGWMSHNVSNSGSIRLFVPHYTLISTLRLIYKQILTFYSTIKCSKKSQKMNQKMNQKINPKIIKINPKKLPTLPTTLKESLNRIRRLNRVCGPVAKTARCQRVNGGSIPPNRICVIQKKITKPKFLSL